MTTYVLCSLQEKILDHDALEKMTEEKLKQHQGNNRVGPMDKNSVKESACCVVS